MSLFVVLAAIVAALVLPVGASAFDITNFSYTNSVGWNETTSATQAAAHPNASIAFTRTGSEDEDLKDVRLDLPTGVFSNPEAVTTKCTTTQFNSDSCVAASQVGTMTANVKALGLLDLTVQGSVDLLAPVANSDEVATLGLTLRPEKICIIFVFCAQPQKMYMKTGVKIKSYEDSGLRTYTPGAPSSATIGIPLVFFTPTINGDITVNGMALNFQHRSGTPVTTKKCNWLGQNCTYTTTGYGAYFWTQTGSCRTATSNVTIVSYQNVSRSASKSFTPTGCNLVPFRPGIAVNPINKNGGQPTALDFKLTIPEADARIQDSLPKIVDLDFPTGSSINLNALTGVVGCTEAQLEARACPAASEIGTAYARSKYLPNSTTPANPGLNGKVYAMGEVGNQVPVGVELIGPRNTIIIFRGTLGARGNASEGTGRVYATFDRIPQLPYKEFGMLIQKQLYKNPGVCTTATTNGVITGFNGTEATEGNGTAAAVSASYTPVNCDTAPDTTITAGPPLNTSDTTPSFSFTSSIPTGATFRCAMDPAEPEDQLLYTPCTSPYTAQPLADGVHTMYVTAYNGQAADETPASYQFTVVTDFEVIPTINVSNTQAVSHPDVSADFEVNGGQPKTIALKLPDGFAASLSSRPLCEVADANAGNCAIGSRIGTASVTVELFGGATETGVGNLYLTKGPNPTSHAAGVAADIQFSFGDLITVGGAYLVENGKNQFLNLDNIPQDVNGTQINVTNLNTDLDGSVDSFLTTPSRCDITSAWISTGVSWAGNDSEVFNVPFTATGCASVPFNPQITQTLTHPIAGAETGALANVSFDEDNSAMKSIRVSEPPSLKPNYPAFGEVADQCDVGAAQYPTSIFDENQCPAQALVGSMQINTPLLPFALNGSVYLIDHSPLPWMGVKFDSPGITVRLTGVTDLVKVDPNCDPLESELGYCQTQISVLFNNVPDVQISSINLTLDGSNRTGVNGTLSGKILKVAAPNDPSCVNAGANATSVFRPFTLTPSVTRTQNIPLTGCNQ